MDSKGNSTIASTTANMSFSKPAVINSSVPAASSISFTSLPASQTISLISSGQKTLTPVTSIMVVSNTSVSSGALNLTTCQTSPSSGQVSNTQVTSSVPAISHMHIPRGAALSAHVANRTSQAHTANPIQ